jgi:hypothetical protein
MTGLVVLGWSMHAATASIKDGAQAKVTEYHGAVFTTKQGFCTVHLRTPQATTPAYPTGNITRL